MFHCFAGIKQWRLPIKELVEADGGNEALEAVTTCLKSLVDNPVKLEDEFSLLQLTNLCDGMSRQAPQFQKKNDNGEFILGAEAKVMWWQTYGRDLYPQLTQAAVRLLSMHATSCASERNWSLWGSVYTKTRNRLSISRAEKLIFIRGNSSQSTRDDDNIMLSLLTAAEQEEAAQPQDDQAGPSAKRQRTAV